MREKTEKRSKPCHAPAEYWLVHHTILPGRRHASALATVRDYPSTFANRLASPLAAPKPAAPTYSNPILPAPSQDPQVAVIGGRYYYCESSSTGIFLRVADDFLDLARSPQIRVWAPPRTGPYSKNVWAPELHEIDGRCCIYFAADDGNNANHRMWVLVSDSGPLGNYRMAGMLDTQGWAIDGTILASRTGERYFVWSGWPGRSDGQQNLYISAMASPTKLVGGRALLATPTASWERRGMPICEGPQVLRRGHRTFVVYSASASWTADYCLGMMVHEGGDFMDARNWRKAGQVFGRNQYAQGVGHCGFVCTPDGDDWILYHAKTKLRPGWQDREVRAQRFTWDSSGFPNLGEPVACGRPLPRLTQRAA